MEDDLHQVLDYYSTEDVLAIIDLWDHVADIDERDKAACQKILRCERRLQAMEAVRKLPATTLSFSAIITYDHPTRSTSAEDASYTSAPSLSREAPIQDAFDRRTPSKVTYKQDVAAGAKLKEKTLVEGRKIHSKGSGEFTACLSLSRLLPLPTTRPARSAGAADSTLPAHHLGSQSSATPEPSRRNISSVASRRASPTPSRALTSTTTPSAPCTKPPPSVLHRTDSNSSPRSPAPKSEHAQAAPASNVSFACASRVTSSPAAVWPSTHAPSSSSFRVSAPIPPVDLPLSSVSTDVCKNAAMRHAPPACCSAPVSCHAAGTLPPRPIIHRLDVPSPSPSASAPIPPTTTVLPAALPHHHSTPCRARVEKSPPRYHLSGRCRRSSSPLPPLGNYGSVGLRSHTQQVVKTGKDPPWRVGANPANAACSRGGYGVFRASPSARSASSLPTR
ncbi:hypothetical protein R3P38DRAFT_3189639 [Favolaschia claudopus]|uniref:Uncharacterized protein n=1 Tax=Favolaschia claudopus TaxID=2862362 RepID=A0AAW0BSW9_9AGAR